MEELPLHSYIVGNDSFLLELKVLELSGLEDLLYT